MSGHFRFASAHHLGAPRDAVFDILADAERWPQWWPQIRAIIRYDDTHGRADIRSVLPLTLRVELTSERADRESGVLRAVLAGDLEGWAQFELYDESPTHTRLDYTQEVDLRVHGPLGGLAAYRIARPLLIANHAFMMRSGMRGLTRAANA